MARFLLCFLLCGCVHTRDPQPSDTKFNEEDRNWLLIYGSEIKIAIKNEDRDAFHFFLQEYIKESRRLKNLDK